MGKHRPSKTDRKKLKIKRDVLFTALNLRFGSPGRAADFLLVVGGRYTVSGVGAWVRETTEGREFAKFVMQYGEAKRRAPYWYKQWAAWHKEQARGQASQPGLV